MIPSISLPSRPIDARGLPARFMFPGELEKLIAIVRLVDRPEAMLEIGCHEGRTAAACLREIPSLKRYVGIDVEQGYRPALKAQQQEIPRRAGHYALHDSRFRLLVSRGGSFDIGSSDIGPMDVIFIDGDHGAEAVRHDTELARAIVRPGGIIIWHDYSNPEAHVTAVLDEEIRRGHEIRHVEKTWLAFEKIKA